MSRLQDPDNYESMKPKLDSMAIVGHTTSRTTRLWFRAYREGRWWLLLSRQRLDDDDLHHRSPTILQREQPQVVAALEHRFTADTGLTHCFEVTGLAPDTRYFYYLIADRELKLSRRIELGGDHRHGFRTLPDHDDITSLRFGFYSCHDPYSVKPASEGIWEDFRDVLTDRRAHIVIGGADQIYCDTNRKERIQDIWAWLRTNKRVLLERYTSSSGVLDEVGLIEYFVKLYRTYYRVYWNFENQRAVYRRFPQYMIWDDHEIMDGWGSLTRAEREEKLEGFFRDDEPEKNYQLVMLMFEAASRVYDEYQHCHNPETPIDVEHLATCQWDYGFRHGDFAFYALDLRGHHDCDRDAYRLLGEEQFTRLAQWANSPEVKRAKAVFVISPVPVVHWNEALVNTLDIGSVKDDFMDEWGHATNHEERNALLDLLLRLSHREDVPIVVLSGDVHCASAFRIDQAQRFPRARLFNVTSSAISRDPAMSKATLAVQRSGDIRGYEGGAFEQLYTFAGAHNFALVNADLLDGELCLGVHLYHGLPGEAELRQKYIPLVG